MVGTEHNRSYGHGYPDEPTDLVNFRLSALGSIRKPRLREIAAQSGPASNASKGTRQVHFDVSGGFVATPVQDRGDLGAGHRFDGPAIVEERTPPRSSCRAMWLRWADTGISWSRPPAG